MKFLWHYGKEKKELRKWKHSFTFVSDLFPEASEHLFWPIFHHFSKSDKKSGKKKFYSRDKLRVTLLLPVCHKVWLHLCPRTRMFLEQECANEVLMVLMPLRMYTGIYDTKECMCCTVGKNKWAESQPLEVQWREKDSLNT